MNKLSWAIIFAFFLVFPLQVRPDEKKTIPVTVAVKPAKQTAGKKYAKELKELIGSSLQTAGWEVIGHGQVLDPGQILKKAGVKLNDDIAVLSLIASTKIQLIFEGRFLAQGKPPGSKGFSLSIMAYETGTGRKLAAAMEISEPKTEPGQAQLSAMMKDAWQRCQPNITKQLSRRLKVAPVLGEHFDILLVNPPKHTDMKLYRPLKQSLKHAEVAASSKALVYFHVHSDKTREALLAQIKQLIEDKLAAALHEEKKSPPGSIVIVFK